MSSGESKPGVKPFDFSRNSKTNWGMLYFDPATKNPAELRIADQINWLNKRSQENQTKFKWLKFVTFVTAGLITILPVVGALREEYTKAASAFVAILGATIIIVERILALNDCRGNWLAYRQTCEELKHEKALYLAMAGPYEDAKEPSRILAIRTELIVGKARQQWLEIRTREEQSAATLRIDGSADDLTGHPKRPT